MFHLKEGDKAPDFTGLDQDEHTIQLKDLKGKKVILYFYPKDDTPGCTKEACNFRDNHKKWLELGYEVIGVSPDTTAKHNKFAFKYDLPFPLIADTDKKIINDYGVWGPKKFMGKTYDGVHRSTFVINEKGIIQKIITKVKTNESTEQLLQVMGLQ